MSFQKATRKQAKLRLAISGPSGSGKTTAALTIARSLVGKTGRIALVDTERGSASLYSDRFDFDVMELDPPYEPERFIAAISDAERAGYDVLILDSITHEWTGTGGILQIVDNLGRTKFRGNSYAAWSEGTPRHQRFIDAMMSSRMNIIATMRSKTAYVQETDGKGKSTISKKGMEPQQRDGLEYEFTTVLDISIEHIALASKDRTGLFPAPFTIDDATGENLRTWLLAESSTPSTPSKPTPPPPATHAVSNSQPPLATPQSKPVTETPQQQTERSSTSDHVGEESRDGLQREMFDYLLKKHNGVIQDCLQALSSFFGRKISKSQELTTPEIACYCDHIFEEQRQQLIAAAEQQQPQGA